MPAWSAPRTWVTGELVTAAQLNTELRDNLLYLKAAPTFDGNVVVTGNFKAGANAGGSGAATHDFRASGSSILSIFSDDAYSTPPVQKLLYGFKYTSGGSTTSGSYVAGGKENATDGNFAHYLEFATRPNGGSATARMRIDSAGKVGIGTTSPQGRLHGYDTIGGFMYWEYDGVDGTIRTIIPNGAGDAIYAVWAAYVVTPVGGGNANTSQIGVLVPSSGPTTNSLNSTGGGTLNFIVNSDGSVQVQRGSGALTYKVSMWLLWQ